MDTSVAPLTSAEQRFRLWMQISVVMYGLGLPLFLLLGGQIAAFLNGLPGSLMQLPPWPAAGTGPAVGFWQVLGISLMSILALLCWHIACDVRRHGPVIIALLGAKLTSTVCYAGLFLGTGNWAFGVGAITDGSIFLLTWILWFLASPGTDALDEYETRILAAAGEAILPSGGAFPKGYADNRELCLKEAGKFFAAQTDCEVTLTRLMMRSFDLLPLCCGYRGRFHALAIEKRIAFFEALEHSRISPLRLMAAAIKLYVVTPYYNLPDAEGMAELSQ